MIDLYRINLNLLVALDVLLQEKSVTLAANKLFLTQAAMSNNLQQLREIFKDELLIREKNHMVLTQFAKELQPRLHQVLQEMHSLIITGQSFVPATSKRIFKIGMPDYIASLLLPGLIAVLQKEAPNIKIEVTAVTIAGNIEPFESGKYDLAIAKVFKIASQLKSTVAFKDEGVCIVNRHSPLAKKKKLSLKDYVDGKHVAIYAENNEFQTHTDQALAQVNQVRDIQIKVPFTGPIFKLVEEAEHLIGTIGKRVATLYKTEYGYEIKALPFEMPTIEYFMLWHQRYDADQGHCWLREQILQIFNTK